MRVKGVSQRLDFSTRRLSRGQWRLLGAIALERELTRSQLAKLAATFGVLEAERPRATAAAGAPSKRGAAEGGPERAREAWPTLDEWRSIDLVIEVGKAQ